MLKIAVAFCRAPVPRARRDKGGESAIQSAIAPTSASRHPARELKVAVGAAAATAVERPAATFSRAAAGQPGGAAKWKLSGETNGRWALATRGRSCDKASKRVPLAPVGAPAAPVTSSLQARFVFGERVRAPRARRRKGARTRSSSCARDSRGELAR